ncbi:MAG: hypothetical protein AN484_11885 [Aphanizomenon flos-aquae WA102]|uniref:Uncharacterized protein n=1 Tax=Aphanizomenon flos-aquae WA102 TaxID=1710896 RepID=A0A1B7X2F7_APHFL|nr:MAG: hypothetical protein AN484_11885 [Aphanizomenon flos-aquae WA102]
MILHPWGTEHGQVGIDPAALYGYWERKDGSEGGGLWFDHLPPGTAGYSAGLDLIDYDGDFELPRSVVAALRAAGVYLDDTY